MSTKKKVLLMGKSGSGKTSMRSIIFANYIARDTMRLGATIDVEHSHVRFLGNLVLNLWDCGGQEGFMENYLSSQRDHVFRDVEVLIYVFDIQSRELAKDVDQFRQCLQALAANSAQARVFCLIHKMDLLLDEQREPQFSRRQAELMQVAQSVGPLWPQRITCFRTSIWDETLYKAWSAIVYSLVPNTAQLEQALAELGAINEAHEVVLFERATFLVISHAARVPHKDAHRFEKISNIIKQFKLSCSKSQASFLQAMHVRNGQFSAFVDVFTSNTYVLLVLADTEIPPATTAMNLLLARPQFEKLLATTNT
eukprot:TRINITY_DN7254_c0_g1_i2.p1 TRINITY_DN7254_c0_g1~~TRINITY_DN7254_c0_g1_i2.p1  ORF type:complete len:311 (-),score=152.45 TRINITY_DN7254_c0_g1_i2:128-1060(-)